MAKIGRQQQPAQRQQEIQAVIFYQKQQKIKPKKKKNVEIAYKNHS